MASKMNEEFWQSRWRENKIGFHEDRPNELLLRNINRLNLSKGDTVFVPLCGKTIDLDWLLSQGFRVIGIEFNQEAVAEVFARQNLVPDVAEIDSLLRFRSNSMTIFVGDVFDLSATRLGKVEAVYDRAALVALPADKQSQYAHHITLLTNQAPQLLITFDYDQHLMEGPPFSVPAEQIERYYGDSYKLECLASQKISGRLSQRCCGNEDTWLLEEI
jgi:thiopurine S-methyltransferase